MKHDKAKSENLSGYSTGQFLLAMPQMKDPRFERSLIYICGHDDNGAMGLVINKEIEEFTLKNLLEHINSPVENIKRDLPVHFGGPVDAGRGFVLHSDDFSEKATLPLKDHISLTATLEILKEIAEGRGPKHCILTMGYVGWSPGQLDTELHGNGWLQMAADFDILFKVPIEQKWDLAMAKLGADLATLSDDFGQA